MKKLSYLLDTNICIYIIKKQPNSVIKKFNCFSPGEIGISSITVAKLYYGVAKSREKEKNMLALNNFILDLEQVFFDEKAATIYGELRVALEKKGNIIGPLDMLIAAHAKSLGLVLITNNTKEFSRISGLSINNWALD